MRMVCTYQYCVKRPRNDTRKKDGAEVRGWLVFERGYHNHYAHAQPGERWTEQEERSIMGDRFLEGPTTKRKAQDQTTGMEPKKSKARPKSAMTQSPSEQTTSGTPYFQMSAVDEELVACHNRFMQEDE